MRPIDFKVDTSLCQALACAEFRFPRRLRLSQSNLDLTVSLRFALMGIAASHFVLRDLPEQEQAELEPELRFFGTMIREHLEQDRYFDASAQISEEATRVARGQFVQLFDRYVELRKLRCPLDLALGILVEEFVQKYSPAVQRKVWFFKRIGQRRSFDQQAQQSLRYALNFYERRNYDLEELPEIALIGE